MSKCGTQGQTNHLDREWVQLIAEAKKLGLSIKDIQKFLKDKSKTKNKLTLSSKVDDHLCLRTKHSNR